MSFINVIIGDFYDILKFRSYSSVASETNSIRFLKYATVSILALPSSGLSDFFSNIS